MSYEIIAAIIGAIIGSLVTGIAAWNLQRNQEKSRRNWNLALSISQTLGSILSAYTPDSLKSRDDVFKLQEEWGSKTRELHLLGEDGSAGPLSMEINNYTRALLSYIEGDMKRGELEHRRSAAKKKTSQLIQHYTR